MDEQKPDPKKEKLAKMKAEAKIKYEKHLMRLRERKEMMAAAKEKDKAALERLAKFKAQQFQYKDAESK